MFDLFEKNKDFSISKILLIFILATSNSALFPLLSKQTKNILENNRLAQHFLGIITIMSLIILYSDGKFCIQRIIIYTCMCYLLFILSTKMDLHFNLMLVLSLLLIFLYQNTIKNEELKIQEDNILTKEEKQNIINNKKKYYLYFTGCIIFIIFIGTILYSNKKEVQYGGGYDLLNYLLY